MNHRIRIGVSSCLLGNPHRYDGGHRHDPCLTGIMGRFFEFVPVCPEVECGLPVPREAMRLVGDPENPRLVTVYTGIDHTERMLDWARQKVRALGAEELCGFIFKSRSPSSGMERVKVHAGDGSFRKVGVGLFAREFMRFFPLLPVEEEGRLHDAVLRENFIVRIFVFKRWQTLKREQMSSGALVAFHTAHKLLLMARSEKHCRAMGKLVAASGNEPLDVVFLRYEKMLLEAMRLKSTVQKNMHVLLHMAGYFKKILSAGEKQELLGIIHRYRDRDLPLIAPITLLGHYARKYRVEHLTVQFYLEPDPLELKLRNHAWPP